MYKILVELYVPTIEKKYDVLIPINKKVKTIIQLLSKAISEMNDINFENNQLLLSNKDTGEIYDLEKNLKEANIINGTKIILS